MYTIKYGSKTLNDLFSINDEVVSEVNLTQNKNEFAYLDFTIAHSHPLYDELKINDLTNVVQLLDAREVIFVGYIYEYEINKDLEKTIKCRDVMSYLSQTIVRPYSTKDGVLPRAPSNPISLLKWLLTQHNNRVPKEQKIFPGNIGVVCDAGHLDYKNLEYPNTFDEIIDKIVNVFGGFIKIRYENKMYYLDYKRETLDIPEIFLDYGDNILDITQTVNSENLVTYIFPTGANIKECYETYGQTYDYRDGYFITTDTVPNINKDYFTAGEKPHDFSQWEWKSVFDKTEEGGPITYYEYNPENDEGEKPLMLNSVNGLYNGKIYDDIFLEGDMIYNRTLVDKYGFIGTHFSDTEQKSVQELLISGLSEMLKYSDFMTNISVKAVDLKILTGKSIGIGDRIRIRSKAHNIDNFFECHEINIDVSSPENTTYQFGIELDTLTNSLDPALKYLDSKINHFWDKEE